MKKYFITFGGGHQNFIDAGNRLTHQANQLDIFDNVILFTDEILKTEHADTFWDKHGKFIEENKRGYGYWLWKPYIIQHVMKTLDDGDILMYLDAGCEILQHKREKILEYMKYVESEQIIGSKTAVERSYNKKDLVMHLDMNIDEHLDNCQREGGVLLLYVTPAVRNLIDQWYEVACSNNYHFIDDTPSIIENDPIFVDHRHDQSIYSLLTKKYNIFGEHDINDIIEVVKNRNGWSIFG
jgi:hypothetical protein